MGNLQGSILAGLVSMLIALEREPETALIDTQGYISKLGTFRVTRAISLIYDNLRQVHGLSIIDVPNDLVELRQVFDEVRSKYPWLEERKISGHQDSQLNATSVLNDMLQVFRLRQTSTITKEAVLVVAIITGGLLVDFVVEKARFTSVKMSSEPLTSSRNLLVQSNLPVLH